MKAFPGKIEFNEKDSTAMTAWIDTIIHKEKVVAFLHKYQAINNKYGDSRIEKLLCFLRWLDLDAKL